MRPEQPVSRILFPLKVTLQGIATIHLGCRLPDTSSDLPGSLDGQPSNASLFGLAPGGVYPASPVTRRTGALLPHRFTLTPPKRGGLLSVALAFASPRLHVMEHPALWCSDFPPIRPLPDQRPPVLLRPHFLLFLLFFRFFLNVPNRNGIHDTLTIRT